MEADLLTPGSFDSVFEGTQYVFHTASPFFIDAEDPQAQLVNPAVDGTRNRSCKEQDGDFDEGHYFDYGVRTVGSLQLAVGRKTRSKFRQQVIKANMGIRLQFRMGHGE